MLYAIVFACLVLFDFKVKYVINIFVKALVHHMGTTVVSIRVGDLVLYLGHPLLPLLFDFPHDSYKLAE